MRFSYKPFVYLFVISALTGCATAPQRNYGGDSDSLNAKVSSLQNEIASKDAEIARLQSQVSGYEASLRQSEDEKRALKEKAESSRAETPTPAKAYASDLK